MVIIASWFASKRIIVSSYSYSYLYPIFRLSQLVLRLGFIYVLDPRSTIII
jgi:hypothetical protein